MNTPVALFLFNRPETTARVFAEIARVRPATLLLVADGPRPHVAEDLPRCNAAREAVGRVDWPCTVHRNFADSNLGCRRRMSSGMDWVFATVPEAIILEDDCLPHPSFFPFCETLLDRYREDTRILQISGCNFQFGRRRTDHSYYFSRYNHIWGWASWRRSWRHYDVSMSLWPALRTEGWLRDALGDADLVEAWTAIFDRTHAGGVNTWDYQWTFAAFAQSALTILPNANLISNIGFGGDATHTAKGNPLASLPVDPVTFPLRHPPFVVRNDEADRFVERLQGYRPNRRPLTQKIEREVRRLLRRLAPAAHS